MMVVHIIWRNGEPCPTEDDTEAEMAEMEGYDVEFNVTIEETVYV